MRRTWLLMSLFLIFIVLIGWFLSYYFESPGILYFAVIFSLGMNFISYWNSDKIVLSMTRAKPIEHNENPELYHIVENLCITAGLPVPKIYILPEAGLNAFATGRDAKHAVIAVTAGLLEKLDKTELEGVIGHELSHIGNRDILLQTIVVVLVGLLAIISDVFLRSRFGMFGGKSRDNDNDQAGAILMVVGLIFIILSPIIAKVIQLAISRKREYLADASGALLTRYPEGLAKALEKISQDSTPLTRVSKATAHLYIANPLKGKQLKNKMMQMFSTHPPIEERIKILREMSV